MHLYEHLDMNGTMPHQFLPFSYERDHVMYLSYSAIMTQLHYYIRAACYNTDIKL